MKPIRKLAWLTASGAVLAGIVAIAATVTMDLCPEWLPKTMMMFQVGADIMFCVLVPIAGITTADSIYNEN